MAEAPSLCHLLRNGIGAAIAYKLGLEGARVIIADNGASLAFYGGVYWWLGLFKVLVYWPVFLFLVMF
jgi:hypothetical protein